MNRETALTDIQDRPCIFTEKNQGFVFDSESFMAAAFSS